MAVTNRNGVLEHVTEVLDRTRLNPVPWPHCYLESALPERTTADILRTFRQFELDAVAESRRDKTYRMRTHRLDLVDPASLPTDEWRALVNALTSTEYRDAMARLTGVPLEDATLTVDLWEYRGGDWLAPHVDKPEKLVTQLFYFTEGWAEQMGGRLLILENAGSQRPTHSLVPRGGASAVLVRSESSWHAVEAVRDEASSRCSIATTFWAGTT